MKKNKPFTFYLSRDSIKDIMKEFKSMGGEVVDNSSNDKITIDGIIINSYSNIDDLDYANEQYTYMIDDKIINTFVTRNNDSLIISEDNNERLINGYDNNIYRMKKEFFSVQDELYSVFPNYKIKCDGSIEKVEGSALENLVKLRLKKCKSKTK